MPFDPNIFVAKWYCGLVGPEHMPTFAADALEGGFDGPALRQLAGLVKPTSLDVGELFAKALSEIRVEIHTKEQSAFKLARILAQAIVDGRVDPIQGAQGLPQYALAADYPAGLAQFYYLAEEGNCEYASRSRDLICADIIAEAQKLIALATT